MKLLNSQVIEHQQVSANIFRTTLEAGEIIQDAKPGQFVYVQIHPSADPLLRRAYSIAGINRETHSIFLLYKVIGKGTADFSKVTVGETVNMMGPLGNPYTWSESFDEALLVGGGIGIAPFPFLDGQLSSMGRKVTFLLGARNRNEMYFDKIFDPSRTRVSTDDGSYGRKGYVIELVRDYIQNSDHKVKIFACGPDPMLRSIAEFAVQNKIPCELSMETTMACGVGVCQGCAIPVWDSHRQKSYKLCCYDGPIFKAEEVRWNG